MRIFLTILDIGLQDIDLSSPLNYGTPSSMGSVRTPRSGIRGTPIRMRPDIRTDKRIRQVNVGGEPVSQVLFSAFLNFFKKEEKLHIEIIYN